MKTEKPRNRVAILEKETKDFLREHPEAARALKLFGISLEYYQEFLAAQCKPIFHTSNSTNSGA